MSDALPPCPACGEEYAYESGALLACPMCGHEWVPASGETAGDTDIESDAARPIKDSVGNTLEDGDDVTIAKDLKVKGAGGGVLKVGTKVRGIRLNPDGADGHDIDAKVPGFGQMQLKSTVVKKVL